MGGECGGSKRGGDATKCQDAGRLQLREMKGIAKDLSAKAKRVAKALKKYVTTSLHSNCRASGSHLLPDCGLGEQGKTW